MPASRSGRFAFWRQSLRAGTLALGVSACALAPLAAQAHPQPSRGRSEGSALVVTAVAGGWMLVRAARVVAFVPGRLQLDAFTRLGARITQVHAAFDDHSPELRWAGKIDTTTVESVMAFLRTRQWAGEPIYLGL